MRKIEIGTTNYTEVYAVDEPEFNANHKYEIRRKAPEGATVSVGEESTSIINFQKGPVKEHNVNGCHHEDLIAIVIDRLESFQKSSYRCNENRMAISHLEDALWHLNQRTKNRVSRGVEGTSAT